MSMELGSVRIIAVLCCLVRFFVSNPSTVFQYIHVQYRMYNYVLYMYVIV